MPIATSSRPVSPLALGLALLALAVAAPARTSPTSGLRPADEPGDSVVAPASAPVPGLAPALCLDRLDAAARLAVDGDEENARRHLERLAGRCLHLPQIQHDLGVLAARAGQTAEAIAAFEASLNADPRAAGTLEQLRLLHRREAALAYARALGAPRRAFSPPSTRALQDSTDFNADSLRPPADRSGLRTPSTVEYELYAWWHSAGQESAQAWLAHYTADYPTDPALAERSRIDRRHWSDVHREIAFTAEDAVAVLEHRGGGVPPWSRLLLLRLQGNRWKIYRETPHSSEGCVTMSNEHFTALGRRIDHDATLVALLAEASAPTATLVAGGSPAFAATPADTGTDISVTATAARLAHRRGLFRRYRDGRVGSAASRLDAAALATLRALPADAVTIFESPLGDDHDATALTVMDIRPDADGSILVTLHWARDAEYGWHLMHEEIRRLAGRTDARSPLLRSPSSQG